MLRNLNANNNNIHAQRRNNPSISPGEGPLPLPTPELPPINQPVTPGPGPLPLPTPTVPPNRPIIPGGVIIWHPGLAPWPSNTSNIRFLHGVPGAPAVDIYMNGRLIVRNLNYNTITEYLFFASGNYRMQAYIAGTQDIVYSTNVSLFRDTAYTGILEGNLDNINFQLITDRQQALNRNNSYLRFVNLVFNSSPLDIYVDDRLVIAGFIYQEVSNYLRMPPGRHTITFKISDTDDTVLVDTRNYFAAGEAYSAFLTGVMYGTPELNVLVAQEGVSYLN